MTLEELEREAMKLDQVARAELLRRLAANLTAPQTAPAQLPPPPPSATEEQKEREWLQEALRRSRELRERQIQTEPPDRRPSAARLPAEAAEPKSAAASETRPKPRSTAKPKRAPMKKKKPTPKPKK